MRDRQSAMKWAGQFFPASLNLPWWGCIDRGAGADPHHHRRGHHLPAPPPGAPRARPASRRQPFLPALAVADHRHGDQGMGRRSTASTTPSARPPEDPHSPQVCGINRVLWGGVFLYVKEATQPRDPGTLRPRHAGRLDRAQRLYSTFQMLGLTLMGVVDIVLFGIVPGRADLGGADGLDPVLGGRRHQRHRPLLGLPQLVHRRTRAPTSCRGAS